MSFNPSGPMGVFGAALELVEHREEGGENQGSASPDRSVIESNYSSTALFPELKAGEDWSPDEKEACKRYTENLKSVLSVRHMKIVLFPSGCPTQVNILHGRGAVSHLCSYSPSATFNAFSYLIKVCGADAIVLLQNIKDETIATCENYYAKKLSGKSGGGTPPVQHPV
jgi:hypothetical protein